MNLDRRIRKLVERLDAEKVTVSISYDKDSWWGRRGKRRLPYEVVVEWGDDRDEKFRADGHVNGARIDVVFTAVEAEIDGILLRQRAGGSHDG